jgi:hypothetical protein
MIHMKKRTKVFFEDVKSIILNRVYNYSGLDKNSDDLVKFIDMYIIRLKKYVRDIYYGRSYDIVESKLN